MHYHFYTSLLRTSALSRAFHSFIRVLTVIAFFASFYVNLTYSCIYSVFPLLQMSQTQLVIKFRDVLMNLTPYCEQWHSHAKDWDRSAE